MSDRENWQPRKMPAMQISMAARWLTRKADSRFRDLGISIAHIPVFVALKNGGKLSQKELTRLAGVEQPSMAQLLARMERDGLIRREADPADGRSSLISLTELAFDKLVPARAIFALGNEEALAGFSPEEVEILVGLLSRVIGNISDGSTPWPTVAEEPAPSAPEPLPSCS